MPPGRAARHAPFSLWLSLLMRISCRRFVRARTAISRSMMRGWLKYCTTIEISGFPGAPPHRLSSKSFAYAAATRLGSGHVGAAPRPCCRKWLPAAVALAA